MLIKYVCIEDNNILVYKWIKSAYPWYLQPYYFSWISRPSFFYLQLDQNIIIQMIIPKVHKLDAQHLSNTFFRLSHS